jgi:hypothetical protein
LANDLFEHTALVRRRMFKDRVSHHNCRSFNRVEQRNDCAAIESWVDTVFMLYHDDVGVLQPVERIQREQSFLINQWGRAMVARISRFIDDADGVNVVAMC